MRMSRGETTPSHRIVAAWRGGDDLLGACRNAVIEERESREGAAAATPHPPPPSTNAATELQFVNCNLHSLRYYRGSHRRSDPLQGQKRVKSEPLDKGGIQSKYAKDVSESGDPLDGSQVQCAQITAWCKKVFPLFEIPASFRPSKMASPCSANRP